MNRHGHIVVCPIYTMRYAFLFVIIRTNSFIKQSQTENKRSLYALIAKIQLEDSNHELLNSWIWLLDARYNMFSVCFCLYYSMLQYTDLRLVFFNVYMEICITVLSKSNIKTIILDTRVLNDETYWVYVLIVNWNVFNACIRLHKQIYH